MSSVPQVSIVIPVYNGGDFLQETVQSAINQMFEDFELLIINDGSTDQTERIARELQNNDKRISYYGKPNSGVSDSRNFGMERVRGEFVVFLDADDILLPDFLQSRIEFLRSHPETGICGSAIRIIDAQGNLKSEIAELHAPGENILDDILLYKPGIASVPANLMHRRSLLTDHQITFDLRLSSSADKMFLCRLAKFTVGHCLPETSFYYRIHANSMYHDPKSRRMLFKDNELFIKILIKENLIPENNRDLFFLKNYYMLAGAGWKAKYYSAVISYGLKYFLALAKSSF